MRRLMISLGWLLVAAAASAADVGNVLPAEWSAVLVVREPATAVDAIREDAQAVGLAIPAAVDQVLAVLVQTPGVDAQGEFALGVCCSDQDAPQPFLLVPTNDADALIEAFDGDPTLDVPQIRLGEQTLSVANLGDWLCVGSKSVVASSRQRSESPTSEAFGPHHAGQLRLAMRPSGWKHLQQLNASRREAEPNWFQAARNIVAGNAWRPTSLAMARNVMLAAAPVLDVGAESHETMTVTIDVGSDNVTLYGEVVRDHAFDAESNNSIARQPFATSTIGDPLLRVQGDLPPGWREWSTQYWLAALQVASEDATVHQSTSSAFRAFGKAATAVASETQWVDALTIVPAQGQPPLANQAWLVGCDSSAEWCEKVALAFTAWSSVELRSGSREKLVFAPVDTTIAGITGKRYAVDLQKAFAAEDVAEVKTLMMQLFGPPGELAYTVLPLSETTVLVSQLPADITERVVRDQLAAKPKVDAAKSGANITFSPANYQRWMAQQYAIEFAGMPHAPQARPLNDATTIEVTVDADKRSLHLKATASRALLREWLATKP